MTRIRVRTTPAIAIYNGKNLANLLKLLDSKAPYENKRKRKTENINE